MDEPYERLKALRKQAGFPSATDAAHRFHWNENTYRSHENGTRGISRKAAEKYGRAFKASAGWILYGDAQADRPVAPSTVPLVGYVGAGAETHFFGESQGLFDEVPIPEATTETVAVEVRGESLGPFFDRWLVFYDDVRSPVTADLIGQLCVAGLEDGRVLIKKLSRGERRGRFTLLSQFEPPIYDITLKWAAKVKHMMPK